MPLDADALLARMPTEPGVYLMKDKKGRVIYVGKAKDLRARLAQYLRGGDERLFVASGILAKVLHDVETVVVGNEKEALLLENNLIKEHQPRFNVKLTDDKNFLVLRIDPRKSYPRVEVGRRIAEDGARYFGPFHSATSARETLRLVNRHFQLRTCTDHVLENRKRPCILYQIKRCPAPCVYPIDRELYGEQVEDAALFLAGKKDELVPRLRQRMKAAASELEYERAAQLRDQIDAVERTLTRQLVVQHEVIDQDVIAIARKDDVVELAMLFMRQGKLMGRRGFRLVDQELPDDEVVRGFLMSYYDGGTVMPDEVLLPLHIEDAPAVEEWLRGIAEHKIKLLVPERGSKVQLLELARKNAEAQLASRKSQADALAGLGKLQARLGLERLPRRIECFDIAHLQGSATVASMVVFQDGEPETASYRRFRVKTVQNDDFASMYEVLARRLRRAKEGVPGWELPDLLMVDGGKGQLATALAAVQDLGLERQGDLGFDIIALAKERLGLRAEAIKRLRDKRRAEAKAAKEAEKAAKRAAREAEKAAKRAAKRAEEGLPPEEPAEQQLLLPQPDVQLQEPIAPEPEPETELQPDRVFLRGQKDPITLRANSTELFLLARVRDEAHRFANTYHRKLRGQRTLRSALEDVPGVGDKRKMLLLRHFGSLKRIAQASIEELAAVPGMSQKAAEAVAQFLAGKEGRVLGDGVDPPAPDEVNQIDGVAQLDQFDDTVPDPEDAELDDEVYGGEDEPA